MTELGRVLQDSDYPIEARSLGRTFLRWKKEIAAWHIAHVTNGPTEAVNNLIKRVKRAAFGFTSFRNYRIRSLLYAGKPNWTPATRPRILSLDPAEIRSARYSPADSSISMEAANTLDPFAM